MTDNLPRFYVILSILLSSFLAVWLPLGEAPDEEAHVARAASLLYGQLLGHRDTAIHPATGQPLAVAGVDIDPGFVAPMLHLPAFDALGAKPVSREALLSSFSKEWTGHTAFITASNTAAYPPFFYVPAAAGLGLARLVGLTPALAVIAGRLSNAAFAILVGWLALQHAARIRPILFVVLTLPMTLHLSASVSQDGILISTTALAVALLTRNTTKSYWWSAVLLGVVAAAKPAYIPFAFLLALSPACFASGSRRLTGGLLLVILPAVGWASVALILTVVPFPQAPYQAGELWPAYPSGIFDQTNPSAQLTVLLHQPRLLVSLPFTTLRALWQAMASSLVGVLGPLDFRLPTWFYRAWYGTIALAFGFVWLSGAKVPGSTHHAFRRSSASRFALVALIVASTVWAIYVLQYLSWTHVGYPVVEGVQGRYFIPVLLVAALALDRLLSVDKVWLTKASLVILIVPIFEVVAIPIFVIRRYPSYFGF